jgi:hypothetical protein
MKHILKDMFYNISGNMIEYIPHLFAGFVLLAAGWFLGWLAKRVLVQICAALRLERFFQRFRWGEDFYKADVRYAMFNLVGNFVFFIIFMIFLSNALSVWKLTGLSQVLEDGVLFFPKLLVALLIFGAGWLIANWSGSTLQKALLKERFPHATLAARFTKIVLLLFFSAMALIQMNVARIIVIIGFTTAIITLGLLAVVLTAAGAKDIIKRVSESLDDEED